jgi:D-threonate/D-erythronate kinase
MPSLSAIPDSTQPEASLSLPAHVWLVADDLTGACDAGVAFLRTGMGVRVWTGDHPCFDSAEKVQAVVTASRHLTHTEAARIVSQASASFSAKDGDLVFKKVDSTLRGPIAAELLAAQQTLGSQAILLAPAFPATGRIVCNAILHAEDASGNRQQISILDLFPKDLQDRIAVISRAEEIAPALCSGKTILICDSATQDDLDALAHAAQPLHGLLYAGSAGLARALAALYPLDSTPDELPKVERTLLICGTTHPVTELQLGEVNYGLLPGAMLLRIACASGDEEHARAAFTSFDPQALVLTGGETALLALRALGVHSLVLRGEFAPGIPWAIAQGGPAHGRIVVTKSGGFGAASALNQLLHALTGAA